MRGHFDVTLLDSGGYSDGQFERAIAEKRVDQLLSVLKVERKLSRRNLIMDNVAGMILDHTFSGPQMAGDYGSYGDNWLNNISLLTKDEDPTYTEDNQWYSNAYNGGNNIGASGSAKRFVADTIDQHQLAVLSGGREGIFFRSRWLFLPAQGVSNNIRSIGICWSRYGSNLDSSINRGRIGRVRLKDDQGRNVILNKTSRQVLLVEYELTLFTI